MNVPTYKVCLIGPGGIGKTKLAYGLMNTSYPYNSYTPTLGVEVHPIYIPTGSSTKGINIWDMGGKYPGGNPSKFFAQADRIVLWCPQTHQAYTQLLAIVQNSGRPFIVASTQIQARQAIINV